MSPYLRESGFRNPRKFCLWNQEFRKFLFVESEILGFKKRNTAQGIRNPLMIAIGNPLPNFHWQRIWNPVSGIRNPRRGIQNLRLSGFHYLRRFMNDFYRFGRYFCWQVARLMSGTGEYRKTGRMKKKKKKVKLMLLNQSHGSWTLFLCKRFLLFQEICIDAGHVSQNTELQCCRTETNPEQLDSSSF